MDYDRFGPYLVLECLGAGGMATVHRAQISIGAGVVKEIALKRLLPQLADDRMFVEDFIREAKLAAQLDHPNIVHILELGEIEGTYYIAMELVRGASLAALMKRVYATKLSAPVGVVVALLSELCDALAYASAGRGIYGQPLHIVHRDLTPSNLIVTDDGRLKIIDFGVAKALSGKFMTNTGMIKGKLGYMSPEAISGAPLDARTDLFSLGVVAWELLSGRRLFRGVNEYEVIMRIHGGDIPPPSSHNASCPEALDEIVLRALARPRDERWASAAELREALDELRRSYGDGATQVARWKDSVIPPARPLHAHRADTHDDPTQLRARHDRHADALEDAPIDGITLAEGSIRKPSRDDLHPSSHASLHRPIAREITQDDEPTTFDADLADPGD